MPIKMSSDNSSALYPLISTAAFAQSSFEMLLHPTVAAISALNLALLSTSHIIHPNLRFILQVESVGIIIFEVQRCALVMEKFISGDIFNPGHIVLQFISRFFTLFRNSIGHVLMIERLMATLMASRYEHCRNIYFSFIWCPILLTICSLNEFTNLESWGVTPLNLATNFAIILLSLIEFLIICLNGMYNLKKYDRIVLALNQRYSLSEKYQLSENIRTSRQLGPAFLCHFINNILAMLKNMLVFFEWFQEAYLISFFFANILSLNSILSAIIEITVITHHPLLKKRALGLLRKIFLCKSSNRVSNNGGINAEEEEAENGGTIPRTIRGDLLIRTPDSDSHFCELAKAWK